MQKDYRVMFTAFGTAGLIESEFDPLPSEYDIVGKNLYSLISTGSERGGFSQSYKEEQYPVATGYASVARAIHVGSSVTKIMPGDLFFHHGNHALYAKSQENQIVSIPDSLSPEKALFGRFAAVSMASIYQSKARPVDSVLVTGLGMVGLMCAQTLRCFGFVVYAVDPSYERREIAMRAGINNVGEDMNAFPILNHQKAGVLYECSGSEKAIQSAIPYLRKGGEIFQIGVPWKKHMDWDVHSLLLDLFYGYLSLHGGWEWSLPDTGDDFHIHTSSSHIRAAMECIADGRIRVIEDMYEMRNPRDCESIYNEIMVPRMKPTSIIMDWRDF